MPIVRSLLETDLYKFTMWQALLHSHPGAVAEYGFDCRSRTVFPLADLKAEVDAELDHLCALRFTPAELDYLRGLRYIKSDFVDFLSVFHFQRRFVTVEVDGEHLRIRAKGPIAHVMGFEIYVLYIVNELYFRRLGRADEALETARKRLDDKIRLILDVEADGRLDRGNRFTFFEFGLRRRYAATWQDEVVATLARRLPHLLGGTSNVHLARTLNLVPIGTMAHEYLQAFQGLGYRLRDFQKAALEGWVQEYRGDLGIALTDVVGMDAFLADFDLYFAKLFDGLRHDSGDPVEWGEKALRHYDKLRINAHTKRLVFSDGLDIPRALDLHSRFGDRIQTAFGIGTNLTNDTIHEPLSIVMKILSCQGQPVAKLSDSPGKTLCADRGYLTYLRQVFGLPAQD
jgi:nicotinate phosphoribosyltransferase